MNALKPRTFRIPLVLAALTAAGLTSALLGDGKWDALSWLALAIPVAVATVFALRSRDARRHN